MAEIDETIAALQSEMPEEQDDRDYYRGETPHNDVGSRSIFDDVDQ